MIDLAIQLVNYKTKVYLKEFLPYLLKDLKESNSSWVINVLDNNSGDDLSDLQIEYRKTGKVNFYYSDKNLGFGAGHNFLAKKIQAKYLLILNTDLKFIEKETIKRLMNDISFENEIKVVGPTLITPQGNIQWWDHNDRVSLLNLPCRKKHNNIMQVAWVSGAVFLIEKKIFDEIGGFDEKFFLYGEEVDLCCQIVKRGGKIKYDPKIQVFHYGSVIAHPGKYLKHSNDYFIDKNLRHSHFYWILKIGNFLIPYSILPGF